jgi:predicted RNase H-like HicB family nuclease
MTRTYLVVFEKGSDGWSAFAPDVPGTGGLGGTVDEAGKSLLEGIGYALEYAVAEGRVLPEATSTSVDFAEFDPDPGRSHYEIEWMTVVIPERLPHTRDAAQQAA